MKNCHSAPGEGEGGGCFSRLFGVNFVLCNTCYRNFENNTKHVEIFQRDTTIISLKCEICAKKCTKEQRNQVRKYRTNNEGTKSQPTYEQRDIFTGSSEICLDHRRLPGTIITTGPHPDDEKHQPSRNFLPLSYTFHSSGDLSPFHVSIPAQNQATVVRPVSGVKARGGDQRNHNSKFVTGLIRRQGARGTKKPRVNVFYLLLSVGS